MVVLAVGALVTWWKSVAWFRNVGTSMSITVVVVVGLVDGVQSEAGHTRARVFGAVAAATVALLAVWLPAPAAKER